MSMNTEFFFSVAREHSHCISISSSLFSFSFLLVLFAWFWCFLWLLTFIYHAMLEPKKESFSLFTSRAILSFANVKSRANQTWRKYVLCYWGSTHTFSSASSIHPSTKSYTTPYCCEQTMPNSQYLRPMAFQRVNCYSVEIHRS